MKKQILTITLCFMLFVGNIQAKENIGSNSEVISTEFTDFALLKNTQDNRYIVSLKNNGAEKLRLSFTDNAGNEIYAELIEGASIYNRRFDLVNLSQGSYKVKLENFGRSVQKEIVVK